MSLVKDFYNLADSEMKEAGGKGASLAEMSRADLPVPPGFVILSRAFDDLLSAQGLEEKIKDILSQLNKEDISSLEQASQQIREKILSSPLPPELQKEIHKQYEKLNTELVAVRSSATAEDSSSAAWAGQLESFLNTRPEELIENIKKCWASLYTPRAISYRIEKGSTDSPVSVAVIVQEMVAGERSGVAFSVHPTRQKENEMLVEAGMGLGQPIVSGTITPDSYIVDKNTLEILETKVAHQQQGLFFDNEQGHVWKGLGTEGSIKTLTDQEITELSRLVKTIEDYYGRPCDIEWTQENGEFYIVQSRPITSLPDSTSTQVYHKIMTRPQSLLDCEFWDQGERIMLPRQFQKILFFDPLFVYTPGKAVAVYYNFTDPDQDPQHLVEFLEENEQWFQQQKKEFDQNCQQLKELMRNNANGHYHLGQLTLQVWPMITVANLIGSMENEDISTTLKNLCIQIREESDDVLHPAVNYFNQLVRNKLDQKDIQNIAISEFLGGDLPQETETKKRNKGWAFHRGNLIHDLEKYCAENNIQLVEPNPEATDLLKGNVGYSGFVQGKAKVIFELEELHKVKEGDILVTPMTTPEMMPVLQKVSAIVTDEGGVTSHAAIVSRELQKPCVIATTNATQVIKDGDTMEVDATQGKVNITK